MLPESTGKQMKKSIFCSLMFILLYVSSAFCSPPVFHGEKLLLRIGYVPIVSQLPLIMSFDHDRFAYQYIDIELSKFHSFTALEAAFRISAIDIAMLPLPVVLAMDEDDVDVRIIGITGRGGSGLFIKKSHSDFKGAIIGIPDLYSNEHFQLIHYLSREYLKYGTDYKVISIPFQSLLNDLAEEKINGVFFPEPYPSLALEQVGPENGNIVELSGQHAVAYSVLTIRGDLLAGECRSGIEEWLKSVSSATSRIDRSVSFFGGEQEAVTQIRYFGFDRDLFKKALGVVKAGSVFRFEKINVGFIHHIGRDMHRLQLLTRYKDLDRLPAGFSWPENGKGGVQ